MPPYLVGYILLLWIVWLRCSYDGSLKRERITLNEWKILIREDMNFVIWKSLNSRQPLAIQRTIAFDHRLNSNRREFLFWRPVEFLLMNSLYFVTTTQRYRWISKELILIIRSICIIWLINFFDRLCTWVLSLEQTWWLILLALWLLFGQYGLNFLLIDKLFRLHLSKFDDIQLV